MTNKEKRLHFAFQVGILLKGIGAFFEILGGALTFLVIKLDFVDTALSLTEVRLEQDPKDIVAHYLITFANTLSVNTQNFVAFYLLLHGVIKMSIIIGLFNKKMWAYPSAMAVFGMFIAYQMYRYTNTHSPWLLILSAFDLLIVWLISQEYITRRNYLK